jgi:peptidoglycan/xylan/chitin deacetylase (PgdA/CDA1 family)
MVKTQKGVKMEINKTSSKISWRAVVKEKMFSLVFQSGLIRAGRSLWKNNLTVLNYHRIDDPSRPGFDTFKPNVSARPVDFALQMDYVARWFNVISMSDVTEWLAGRKFLPQHAALITFDDGYRDNYLSAFPILRERKLPAVVFLTSGYIQQDTPFYWDLIAYCFTYTKHDHVTFPNGHEMWWKNEAERDRTALLLIESLKRLPEMDKQEWVQRLPRLLNVTIPGGHFQDLMMSWDQIREMQKGGIEFGGHTVHHPILTRISLAQAEDEIKNSKLRIEQELGPVVKGFAYPNGGSADFNHEIELLTAKAGYQAAFSLINGPTSQKEIKQNPFAIRRIFISHKHTLPQFSTLISGFNRYRPA